MPKIVESMDPRIRSNLQDKNIDPIIYHFRMKATKEFRMQQQQKAVVGQQGNMNFNAMGNMSAQNQNMGMPTSQSSTTPYLGSIDQFRGQQEAGMRSQQEGQLVVPASNPNASGDMLRAQQQMIANQIRQRFPNANPQQLAEMMKAQMTKLQQQHLQRQMQAGAQSGMMPNIGQGQNLTSGTPQPRNMSMLNQPMNPNMPGGSPAQNLARPASRPQGNQMVPPGQPAQTVNINQIQQNFARLPPVLQAKLRNTPNQAEWPGIVTEWRTRQGQIAQQQFPRDGADMRRSASQQPGQDFQRGPSNQFGAPPPMQPSLSAGAEQNNMMPNMTPVQRHQQPMNANAQSVIQMQQIQQQRQQQIALAQQNAANQQNPEMRMVQALIQESDNWPVPQQFLIRIQGIYMGLNLQLPPIQNWAQLKQFVRAHPNQKLQVQALVPMQAQHARSVKAQASKQNSVPGGPPSLQPPMPGATQGFQNQGVGGQGQQRQVTQQDVQRMKMQNSNYAHLSDSQVRDMLTQKLNTQKPQQQVGPPVIKVEPGQNQGLTATQAQSNTRIQHQQVPKPGHQVPPNRPQLPNQTQNQGQTQTQHPPAAKPNENRLKRPNQDEAQDNLQQRILEVTKAEFDSYTPEQKQKYLEERKKIENTMKLSKMRKINQEVQNTMSLKKPPPIPNMDPQSRQHIIKLLTSENTRKILERFDSFLLAFDQFEKDDTMLKLLIQHRWHLMQQFKPESWANKSYQPADNFTLQAEHIEKILSTLSAKFQQAIAKSQTQNVRPQLTQENLSLVAKEAAQQQKLNKVQKPKDGPPPAPTVDKPPFQFPDDRGRGAPKYGPGGLKPEDLKLPPNKRLKGTPSAPSTPVQAPQQKPTFKCTVPGCNTQSQGFNTQAELEAHRNMAHQELSIKDPVGFLNGSLQQAFNLDSNMDLKKPAESRSANKLTTKSNGKPLTPTAMVRGLSQQTNKAALPSQGIAKTSGAYAGEPAEKPSDMVDDFIVKDEWEDSTFTFDDLTNVFGSGDQTEVIPTQGDNFANSMRAVEAYMLTDEWKQAIGTYNSSENSSNKSKSPDQGSEQSLPTKTQKEADKEPFYVDLTTDGTALPVLEGNFEDLFVNDEVGGGDWTMVETEGSLSPWEKIDGASDGDAKKKDDFWPELVPFEGDRFPEDEVVQMLEDDSFDKMLATNDPEVFAKYSMEWNAIGKKGEEMRRALGWPIEGAEGRPAKAHPASIRK